MILANRALWGLGLALVILLVALVAPALVWAALALDVLVFGLLIVDVYLGRRLEVSVTRTIQGGLYQGSPADVVLSRGGRVVAGLRVRDPLAPEIHGRAEIVEMSAVEEHRFRVTPTRRGEVTLGPLTGRVLGPLGLVWTPRVWAPPTTVRVMPRVVFDGEDGLYLRGQLESRASVRVDRRRAPSGELHALRDYVIGDDVRRIHWGATARQQRPIVADLEWERHQQVVLLLDGGRAMGALAAGAPKLDQALSAMLALLRVAVVNDDHVTVVLYSDAVRKVVSVDGRARSWPAVFNTLYAEHSDGRPSDHLAAAAWVGQHIRRRSLVVLFTSVGDAAAVETLAPALTTLRRRHRAVLVDLEDPAVIEKIRNDPPDEAALCAMASAWAIRDRNDALATRLRRGGIEVVRATADRMMVQVIRRYLEIRGQGLVG